MSSEYKDGPYYYFGKDINVITLLSDERFTINQKIIDHEEDLDYRYKLDNLIYRFVNELDSFFHSTLRSSDVNTLFEQIDGILNCGDPCKPAVILAECKLYIKLVLKITKKCHQVKRAESEVIT